VASAALTGKVALVSLELIATVSLVLNKFQFPSTALTVTLKAVPATAEDGCPTLPLEVPGTGVSPGASSCNFANAPGLTVNGGLALGGLLPSLRSLAVIVQLPTVVWVTFYVLMPEAKPVLEGSTALGSV